MNGWKRYIQKRVNRDKIDFATIACMLGLPASVKAPVLAATGGRAVAQLIAPWLWSSIIIINMVPVMMISTTNHFIGGSWSEDRSVWIPSQPTPNIFSLLHLE